MAENTSNLYSGEYTTDGKLVLTPLSKEEKEKEFKEIKEIIPDGDDKVIKDQQSYEDKLDKMTDKELEDELNRLKEQNNGLLNQWNDLKKQSKELGNDQNDRVMEQIDMIADQVSANSKRQKDIESKQKDRKWERNKVAAKAFAHNVKQQTASAAHAGQNFLKQTTNVLSMRVNQAKATIARESAKLQAGAIVAGQVVKTQTINAAQKAQTQATNIAQKTQAKVALTTQQTQALGRSAFTNLKADMQRPIAEYKTRMCVSKYRQATRINQIARFVGKTEKNLNNFKNGIKNLGRIMTGKPLVQGQSSIDKQQGLAGKLYNMSANIRNEAKQYGKEAQQIITNEIKSISNNRNAQQSLGMNTDRLTKRMQKAANIARETKNVASKHAQKEAAERNR